MNAEESDRRARWRNAILWEVSWIPAEILGVTLSLLMLFRFGQPAIGGGLFCATAVVSLLVRTLHYTEQQEVLQHGSEQTARGRQVADSA